MIANFVAVGNYVPKNNWMFFNVIADTEERCFNIKLPQRFKHEFRGTRHWPVVKC